MTGSFEYVQVVRDSTRRHWRQDAPRPITVHIWRPTAEGPRPTVLMSHGAGGAAADLAWWAESLAAAGFVVIGVDHHGNNHITGYLAEGFAAWWDRPLDLTFALHQFADETYVDLDRVGACGFSLGGFTASALVGVRVDRDVYEGLTDGRVPVPPTPEFPNVLAELRTRWSPDEMAAAADKAAADYTDKRVRAAFLLAPSQGPALAPASLASVTCPVAVRWGEADDIAVPAANARRYADLIPGADGRSLGVDVDHYVFAIDDRYEAVARDQIRATVAAQSVDFFAAALCLRDRG